MIYELPDILTQYNLSLISRQLTLFPIVSAKIELSLKSNKLIIKIGSTPEQLIGISGFLNINYNDIVLNVFYIVIFHLAINYPYIMEISVEE